MLSACNLPRGAALRSEILDAAPIEELAYSVVPVTQDSLKYLEKWPTTGWRGHYVWPDKLSGRVGSRIRSGDLLNLTIWDNEENSLFTDSSQKNVVLDKLKVMPSGDVFLPYIGAAHVTGLSGGEARELLQKKLSALSPSAQVLLEIEAGPRNSVNLVSGVGRSGAYPLLSDDYAILTLLSQGGGVSARLNYPILSLQRAGKVYEIPVSALFEDPQKNIYLRGGDSITVREDDRFFIALGAAGSQKPVFFPREKVSALDAISLFGGLKDGRADPKGIIVLREYEQKALTRHNDGPKKPQVIFTLDLTSADGLFAAKRFLVHPQDVVLATESPIKDAQTILGLLGSVLKLATYVD